MQFFLSQCAICQSKGTIWLSLENEHEISRVIINILPLIEGVMVDYHTQNTNIVRSMKAGHTSIFAFVLSLPI